MARERWLSIKVELLSGGGLVLEHSPGRTMIVSPRHTLAELAEALDLAFARWGWGWIPDQYGRVEEDE